MKRNQVSFLITVLLTFNTFLLAAQETAPPIFARISMFKATPGKEAEYLKYIDGTIKPALARLRDNGKIVQWILFKVHFAGGMDEYNYVGVVYSVGWDNTQPFSLPALLKEIDPNVDPVAIDSKLREYRTLVREHLVYRVEAIEPNPPVPSRYVRLDYMKVKPGMNDAYLKAERDDWMPFHKTLVNDGQSTGWGLWQLVFPGGTEAPYHFVTSNRYANYADVMAADYEKSFKKASPAKNMNDIINRTTSSRDLVRSELWEVVNMLN